MTLPDHENGLLPPEQRVSLLEDELAEARATTVEVVLLLANALRLDERQRDELALVLEMEAGSPGTTAEFVRSATLAATALRDTAV